VPTDVSQPRQVERLAQSALNAFQRIDVWINNASAGALGPFERVPLGDHTQVIATTLLGTLYGSYVAYRQFLAQGAGILINVASELDQHTAPDHASYAAATHGVVALSDSLRQEVAQQGRSDVHVCLVMPAAHDDPQHVIDTLVRLAADPTATEIVGADGFIKQMEDAPPAGDTPGTVHAPTPEGRGISAGRRKAS
jgi:NAD(P)-dependent dehydrogenase (short-subunit alcohol dehydrogenase family)